MCTLFAGGNPDGHEFVKTSQEISTKIKSIYFNKITTNEQQQINDKVNT